MTRPTRITIIGNGSLGSFTSLLLAKMAPAYNWRIHLVDHDTVENHNLLNQLYREEDVGKEKPEALLDILSTLAERAPVASSVARVDSSSELTGIVITLVDSMQARKEIFAACAYNLSIPLYIEARSGEKGALVYAFDPRDPDCVRRYEKTLYSDAVADPAPCATEQTIPILWAVAAIIGKLVSRLSKQVVSKSEFVEALIGMDNLPNISTRVYTENRQLATI